MFTFKACCIWEPFQPSESTTSADTLHLAAKETCLGLSDEEHSGYFAQVASMVAALSQLADAYLAIADKAAAEALSSFQSQQTSAASPASPQHGFQASSAASGKAAEDQPGSSSSLSAGPQQGSKEKSAPAAQAAPKQRYPDHVHDPLKVQHELKNAKAAALQCVTELYRGLLYVVLYHCHGKRRV